jgi:acetylornithine/LysW-gamma-L-lysine aminotransferase
VIEHLVRENIPKRAADRGAYFIDQLRAIDHPEIREVRGQGLMIGVELKHPAGSFARNMMNEGVLALLAGNNILRFLPPLIIDTAEIDQVVSALRRVLN